MSTVVSDSKLKFAKITVLDYLKCIKIIFEFGHSFLLNEADNHKFGMFMAVANI